MVEMPIQIRQESLLESPMGDSQRVVTRYLKQTPHPLIGYVGSSKPSTRTYLTPTALLSHVYPYTHVSLCVDLLCGKSMFKMILIV